MATFFLLLAFTSFLLLIAGLIKPAIIMRWGEDRFRTRKVVSLIFGVATFVFLILAGITAPEVPKTE